MRYCKNCGKSIESKHKKAKYCSNGCRQEAYRKRNGIDEPDFLKSKKNRSISKLGAINNYVIPSNKIDSGHAYINKLQSELNLLYQERHNVNNGDVSFWAIAGAVGGASIPLNSELSGMDKLIGALGLGYLGYKLGEEINKNSRSSFDKKAYLIELSAKIHAKEKAIIQAKNTILKFEKLGLVNSKKAVVKSKPKSMSLKEIAEYQFPTIDFSYSKLSQLLGYDLGEPFYSIIWGSAGQGKSTFSLIFASEISRNLGRVLYVSAEEAISKNVQQIVKRNKLQTPHVEIQEFTSLKALERSAKAFKYLFIDSLNASRISNEDLEALKVKCPETSIIAILQATKDGRYRGTSEFMHNTDIEIEILNGVARTNKNRYSHLSEYEIFNQHQTYGKVVNL